MLSWQCLLHRKRWYRCLDKVRSYSFSISRLRHVLFTLLHGREYEQCNIATATLDLFKYLLVSIAKCQMPIFKDIYRQFSPTILPSNSVTYQTPLMILIFLLQDYLSLKCFLLERFMHDLLFESHSPSMISTFLDL